VARQVCPVPAWLRYRLWLRCSMRDHPEPQTRSNLEGVIPDIAGRFAATSICRNAGSRVQHAEGRRNTAPPKPLTSNRMHSPSPASGVMNLKKSTPAGFLRYRARALAARATLYGDGGREAGEGLLFNDGPAVKRGFESRLGCGPVFSCQL
jgi:hypothetical protein